ncbi:2-aminoethylphosphonate--pyruvate transaminase 2 [Rhodovastum atsumiense]|uniref:2-aminoethylphosphonate--pyruvate transaminase n=1 Tax=Rhodovastum atsumiense TaxID=504468 RepID=A0A5M6IZ30_9PROT|nr:2-aminoethylphosphonate--pyruvate transaminase [Rhodovastum atsumiense]KAA5612618.1 2-aminoethylphosphonate--pyruvate transaminase [Rhodovastum atsumiense]CAH2601281.1 2-aminoethylphosphonate--pyruvate transaminase 2 [Rhodovastum atsumiense]
MPDPYLLTPGPLTTSAPVKQAMLRDWGSRDETFIAMNRRVRARLAELAGAEDTHVCVPVQGSGTFAVEAALGTLVPRTGRLLVLVNGAYGRRMVQIARVIGRDCRFLETAENEPVSPAALDRALDEDPDITHVAVVQCETTTGLLNPVEEVAAICARHGRALLIDAMSGFGALPLDARRTPFEAVMASANKCLEGVPGLGFVIVRQQALEAAAGNAHSLSLDLHAQWRGFEQNGQWRFTPPTHVLAALDRALDEHAEEGGVAGRGARYRRNLRVLLDGMAALGFVPLLPAALQAPIIVTFRMPADPRFAFDCFYEGLRRRGYVIYPGKLTVAESFRMGCIGRLDVAVMQGAVAAVANTLGEMGVRSGAPQRDGDSTP